MNAILLAAVLGAWPQLPPDPSTAWPELPPIGNLVVSVSEEGQWSASQVAEDDPAAWPDLPEQEPSSVEEELLLKPPPLVAPAKSAAWRIGEDGRLTRLPGPRVPWPHQGCLMCLGIHLERTHKVPMDYLQTFGREQWDVIHCNLHNEALVAEKKNAPPDPPKTPQKKATGGCSGGACSSPSAFRWRARFR